MVDTGAREVYLAVCVAVNGEGTIESVTIDDEALVGSRDGFVWNPATEEWGEEWDDNVQVAYRLMERLISLGAAGGLVPR